MPSILEKLNSQNEKLNLDFEGVDWRSTNMFKGLGESKGIEALSKDALTYNNHKWGIPPATFKTDENLKAMFKATSTSKGLKTGHVFVASMEALEYPFMGV